MRKHDACLVCGQPLVYRTQAVEMTCAGCGKTALSNAACRQGHFICDQCHGSAGRVAIRLCGLDSSSRNPIEIAKAMMDLPGVHMHGPEHHTLVGSALLAAYKNSGGALDLEAALQEMDRRGGAVPGGICGLWGCCGAAVSAGIFVSIATASTPMAGQGWGLANRMTAACLEVIGVVGGPRCCKRDSYLALLTAADFCARELGVTMELPQQTACTYFSRNRECLKLACPFFPRAGTQAGMGIPTKNTAPNLSEM